MIEVHGERIKLEEAQAKKWQMEVRLQKFLNDLLKLPIKVYEVCFVNNFKITIGNSRANAIH